MKRVRLAYLGLLDRVAHERCARDPADLVNLVRDYASAFGGFVHLVTVYGLGVSCFVLRISG